MNTENQTTTTVSKAEYERSEKRRGKGYIPLILGLLALLFITIFVIVGVFIVKSLIQDLTGVPSRAPVISTPPLDIEQTPPPKASDSNTLLPQVFHYWYYDRQPGHPGLYDNESIVLIYLPDFDMGGIELVRGNTIWFCPWVEGKEGIFPIAFASGNFTNEGIGTQYCLFADGTETVASTEDHNMSDIALGGPEIAFLREGDRWTRGFITPTEWEVESYTASSSTLQLSNGDRVNCSPETAFEGTLLPALLSPRLDGNYDALYLSVGYYPNSEPICRLVK